MFQPNKIFFLSSLPSPDLPSKTLNQIMPYIIMEEVKHYYHISLSLIRLIINKGTLNKTKLFQIHLYISITSLIWLRKGVVFTSDTSAKLGTCSSLMSALVKRMMSRSL